jgi:predicted alpha/beta-fold hydrolase
VLSAADDYILAPQDIPQLEKLAREQGPQEVMRVFSVGGHVGLDWNPKVAETMIDFAVGGHRG